MGYTNNSEVTMLKRSRDGHSPHTGTDVTQQGKAARAESEREWKTAQE